MRNVVESKIATIVPIYHLYEISGDDYFMALSYAAHNPEYMRFFRRRSDAGKYVILDNSTVEMGEPETTSQYIRKAVDMGASEILTPDWLHDPARTLGNIGPCLEMASQLGYKGNFMVAPQGRTLDEWFECAMAMLEYPIHTIGISRRYTDMFGGSRIPIVDRLVSTNSWKAVPGRRIHLLGCWQQPQLDVGDLLERPEVRGIDGSLPSVFSMLGMQLTSDSVRPQHTKINIMTDRYEPALMHHNVGVWRMLCAGVPVS